MTDKTDPRQEGHTKEWQDRARVVLDAKKAAQTEASPNQSPEEKRRSEKEEEKDSDRKPPKGDDDPVY